MLCEMPQNRLRSLRAKRGLTLERLSQATGVSLSTLHAIENDERRDILLGTAFRLAQFYGLPVETLWEPLYDQICQH
jgi:transcriptional regulator with XRE-family HTH domain